ncbi:hypothetical protein SAMN04488535_0170 [Corynebacterium mycetoides]|uniref:Uncharacterized protein n=1 Tax=Corynebacterium mycetoides TaxID=38302 RepID=A0A1G9LJB5_9CORY|nr:hypothetical protein SAMN04488535_0170 [Corynebacterium mycetoides]
MFHSTMRGMDKIAFTHSSQVDKALRTARRSTQTRQIRAFNQVGGNISRRISQQSRGLKGN